MLADLLPLPPRTATAFSHSGTGPPGVQFDCLVAHLRRALLTGGGQRERGHVLFTDRAWRYLGDVSLGVGGGASLVLDPRAILKAGFALGAQGMVLAHNHPSGQCRPSKADHAVTDSLRWLGGMVDLVLLDHLIVTADAVYSMRAGGLL